MIIGSRNGPIITFSTSRLIERRVGLKGEDFNRDGLDGQEKNQDSNPLCLCFVTFHVFFSAPRQGRSVLLKPRG